MTKFINFLANKPKVDYVFCLIAVVVGAMAYVLIGRL